MAKRVPKGVRRDVGADSGALHRRREHAPGALPREAPATVVEEQRRPTSAARGEPGTSADEVGLDRLEGHPSDRHEPLLAALAAQQRGGRLAVEVVHVEPDRLGDPGAGAVEHLEQRPVAQRPRGALGARRVEDRLDLGDRDRLGQPLGQRRRTYVAARVGRRQALARGEPVEPAHRYDGPTAPRTPPGAGARRHRCAAPRGTPTRRPRSPPSGSVTPRADAERLVAGEVAAVGGQRVGSEPPLDRQVVEVERDSPRQRCRTSLDHAATLPDITERPTRPQGPVGSPPSPQARTVSSDARGRSAKASATAA